MHIVQILPALDEGGVERGTVELNAALVARGYRSTVISSGGRLVPEIEREYRAALKLVDAKFAVRVREALASLTSPASGRGAD